MNINTNAIYEAHYLRSWRDKRIHRVEIQEEYKTQVCRYGNSIYCNECLQFDPIQYWQCERERWHARNEECECARHTHRQEIYEAKPDSTEDKGTKDCVEGVKNELVNKYDYFSKDKKFSEYSPTEQFEIKNHFRFRDFSLKERVRKKDYFRG